MMSSSAGVPEKDAMMRAALAYAAHGRAVFPVQGIVDGRCGCRASDCSSPGKYPLTRRGLKDATTDAAAVDAWWKKWPTANLTLVTGRTSGVLVIDIDVPRGELSLAKLLDAGYELPETSSVRTGSGGLHLYYAAPGFPVGNSAGRLPGVGLELPGVDLRADGGYVVAPPSLHLSGSAYEWTDGAAGLTPAPRWLRPVQEGTTPKPVLPGVATSGSNTPYGLAALEGELDKLRLAPKGTRNHTLNRCAFCLGRLVGGGELAETEVVTALRAGALGRGLSPREIERTITSGISAGIRYPRTSRG